jgi:hypothetical protein
MWTVLNNAPEENKRKMATTLLTFQDKRLKNLGVLQSVDPNVLEIIEEASHVALYQYSEDNEKWDRIEVEGTAFITRNREFPFYSMIVLNKKGIMHVTIIFYKKILYFLSPFFFFFPFFFFA